MKKYRQNGFTLIELTMVMAISILVAGMLIGMFRAHVQMLTQAVKFQFLAQDAPFIGLLLTKTIGNAEDYRIYPTGPIARNAGAPVLSGLAVKLWMRQPNSTFRLAVVSFETFNNHPGLYFFLADSTTGLFAATPNWELAGGQLTNATFDVTNPIARGVLLATLTGSNNDWYIFAAEKK